MTRIYGHKWSSIAESDDGTWLNGLSGITPEQVSSGLSNMVNNLGDWPPTLPEFKKMCLDIDQDDVDAYVKHKAMAKFDSHYQTNYLTTKELDSEIARVRKTSTSEYMTLAIQESNNESVAMLENNQKQIKNEEG